MFSAKYIITPVLLVLLGLMFSKTVSAQNESSEGEQPADTAELEALEDTVVFEPGGVLVDYSPVDNPVNFEERRTQNPTVALFKSMVVPGLGQLGNGKYFKAILFLGADAWFISSAIRHGQDASDLFDEFESVTGDDDASIQLRRDLYDRYQDKRDSRNWFTWLAVITSFVSMFDAYTDAHLSGFPVKQDESVTISLEPTTSEDTFIAALHIRF